MTAPRILVAEDDDDTRARLCDALELQGYQVSGVCTAAATLGHEHLNQFTAILLDRKLPDGTADELIPKLSQLAPNASCIIVTGQADLEDAIVALRDTVSDYVVKPIGPESLRSSLLRIRRLADAERRAAHAERLAAVGQMVASIGHESRNALQRIKARVELMRLNANGNSELLQNLKSIDSASDSLVCMFDELREFTRTIELDRRPCRVRDLIASAWDSLQAVSQNGNVSLKLQMEDVWCDVDPGRMEQVFRNLLENAVEAANGPAHIAVTAERIHVFGQPVAQISFHDNGCGFTDYHRHHAFEPFVTTKTKGTGLGLPICRRIVELHEGRVEIAPFVPDGARIVVTLNETQPLSDNDDSPCDKIPGQETP